MKCTECGYTLSLHQEKSDPEDGYGYNHPDIPVSQISVVELRKVADDWNAKGLAHYPEKGKWIVTALKEQPESPEVMAAPSAVTAQIAETMQWIPFANMRGFVFCRGECRLDGMIVVHLDDLHASFEQDWKRYSTMDATVIYTGERDKKDNPIVDHIEWGPFSDLTKEEALAAIEAAIKS